MRHRWWRAWLPAVLGAAAWSGPAAADPVLVEAARAFVPGAVHEVRRGETCGVPFDYLALADARGDSAGYVFRTGPLAPDVQAFAGPIDVAAAVTADGVLVGVSIIESSDTRSYVRRVQAWLPGLYGRRLFAGADVLEADALTGATQTSAAVLEALHRAGQSFAAAVLEEPAVPAAMVRVRRSPAAFWVAAALVSVLLRFRPSRWLRRAWLLAVVIVFGWGWNLQVSSEWILRAIRLDLPGPALTKGFLLTVGAPLLVLLAGNLVCGWLCPFGALQELLGDWRRGRVMLDPDRPAWSRVRRVKYLILAVLVMAAVAGCADQAGLLDPLAWAFAPERAAPMSRFATVLLVFSLMFGRFWCRNLCPAGAAFSLLGRVALLRKVFPRIRPGHCDYGVVSSRSADCILCDRCRQPGAGKPPDGLENRTRARWLAAVLVLALSLWAALGVAALT